MDAGHVTCSSTLEHTLAFPVARAVSDSFLNPSIKISEKLFPPMPLEARILTGIRQIQPHSIRPAQDVIRQHIDLNEIFTDAA